MEDQVKGILKLFGKWELAQILLLT
jgi:hypothetical protein